MHKDITRKQVLNYILSLIKPFPVAIFIMFWVAIVWSLSVSINPYLLKIIINRLSQNPADTVFSYLAAPILWYLGMYAILKVSYRLYGYFVEIRMIPYLRTKVAAEAMTILLNKNHIYFQNHSSGALVNKVNDLIRSVPTFLQTIIDKFFTHGLALAIAIISLWQVSAIFAIAMLLWALIFILGVTCCAKWFTHYARAWSEWGSVLIGHMVDMLSNILSIRLFTGKIIEKAGLNDICQEAIAREQRLEWSYFWMFFSYGFSSLLLQAVNFYFLCKGRSEGWISVGDFALVVSLNCAIFDFLWKIGKEFSEFSKLYGRIVQALDALLNDTNVEDSATKKSLVFSSGEIVFSHVQFHYANSKIFFNDVCITIKAGEKIGLVGFSGGGKTTFVNLILRLYEVTNGTIFIDGQDISHVSQESIRDCVAMIPQDPSLFNRTLMENIRYGKMDATDEEVIQAAKRAYAHDFIMKLPEGYQTCTGERGIKLSGGQRQRIVIARAILKNAPILILDEATSQLDSLTESEIQTSLWQLMQSKTTLVIAHRLSTLLNMDRILVFEKGAIVESGTHNELMKKNGLYRTLWNAQVCGFLPERTADELEQS